VFVRVSTGTKSIKIDQETPELLSKTKWHGFLWLTVYVCNNFAGPYVRPKREGL